MDPKVQQLADKIGVKFSDRCSADSWIYDGSNIALKYRTDKWDDQEKYIRDVEKYFTDHDNLHEMFHYLVAGKEQRKIHEYGLIPGIQAYTGAFGKRDKDNLPDDRYRTDGICTHVEQELQEWTVINLCIYWGRKLNLSPGLTSASNEITTSWDAYEHYKKQENLDMFLQGKELMEMFL